METMEYSLIIMLRNKRLLSVKPFHKTTNQLKRIKPSRLLPWLTGLSKLGKIPGDSYKYGAPSGQTRYFDCSLFVQTVFKENGIKLPRSSREQARMGTYVPRGQLQKGDLVFFTAGRSDGQIGHVGIYAGNNKILHTYGPGGVRYDSMSTPWLDKTYVTARRVIR